MPTWRVPSVQRIANRKYAAFQPPSQNGEKAMQLKSGKKML
jgi:hypothetical protein